MIHPGRFDAKIAVVTGAAQGIGQTVAVNLAREGGKVALVDRSELIHEVREKLVYELRDKLPAGGAEILALVADLERYADCCAVMSRARKHFGRIDILINNVGGTIWAKPYEYYEEPQIEAEIRRSPFPTLWCCRAMLPYMLEQGRGTIVNVSSIGTRSVNRVPYAAAKGGVNALTASLAFAYSGKGIRVVAAAQGGTEAPVVLATAGAGVRCQPAKSCPPAGSALPGRHRGGQGGPHRLHRAGMAGHQLDLRDRLVQQHGETADHRAPGGQG
jgi:dihydroxycyclohexadiene carboxylate dehydrogenase